ncbi:uncharacterized protein A1O5_12670 [Cladophialophora psammophila CBS 110553]|uniref:Cyclin C-terminal domain-containing protein n=1 Tax=Cladophialophora psammophila CBS 110553 TaxID=1182543 RepID=W9WCG8_9EURO|nr:uncharacterized protein A1O5_12670 [Cladophialophora psammophila CBS 110553]EXJ56214.1 hypothetical protein A1O5_12670 [Cladophialophora psammophila CBS 110553]
MHREPVEPQEEPRDKIFEDQLPPSDYLSRQIELDAKGRSIVVTWFVRLRKYCNFSEDTLHKTVNTFDRFMALNPTRHGDIPRIAAGALAATLGANGCSWMNVQDTIGLFHHSQVTETKKTILEQLGGSLFPATPMQFLDEVNQVDGSEEAPKVLAKYLLEAMLYDKRFIGKLPSLMAAASYCLAREVLGKGPWSSQHVQSVQYTRSALEEPITTLLEICQNPKEHHPKTMKMFNEQHAALFAEMEKGLQKLKPSSSTTVQSPTRTFGVPSSKCSS